MAKKINVLSLFGGIECWRVAMERLGWEIGNYYSAEIDPYAIKITKANYPDIVHIGSVTEVDGTAYEGKIDILIGWSPCQSFSIAWKQEGFDGKSWLFYEYLRILKEVKPRYFLLENVKMKKEWKDIISKELWVEPIEISSSLVSAQNRKRLYWTNIPWITQPEELNITISEIIKFKTEIKLCSFVEKKLPLLIEKYWKIPHIFNPYNLSEITDKSPALTAQWNSQTKSSSIIIYEDGKFFMLNANAWETLQNLPIDYTFWENEWIRKTLIWNWWTVDVIKHILSFCYFTS